jgi:hypothetical protein
VSWDATYLYVGYQGADVNSGSAAKWVQLYLDTDPGGANGATSGLLYNTESPGFPTGFQGDLHIAWKADGSFNRQMFFNSGWTDEPAGYAVYRNGDFLKFRIPLASIGNPAKVGVVAFMMNETDGAEAAYAGLYSGSFADGYHALVPISSYLLADFALAYDPNAAENQKP